MSPEESADWLLLLLMGPSGVGCATGAGISGASLARWEVNLEPSFTREPPSDFSPGNVTVPGMSLSESHLPKDVSQKSPDPDRGLVGDLTEQESGCL